MAGNPPTRDQYFAQARDIAFVIAIFLYFIAFEYRWEFFRSFGVDVGLFDVPTFAMIVYAIPVIESTPGLLTIFLLAAGAILTFVVVRHFKLSVSQPVAIACAILATFLALQGAAHALAQGNHDQVFAGKARNVAFTFREPDKSKLADTIEYARGECVNHVNDPINHATCDLYLIADSPDAIYVLYKPLSGSTLPHIIELRKEQLASLTSSVTK
jgi:hypothetical protein